MLTRADRLIRQSSRFPYRIRIMLSLVYIYAARHQKKRAAGLAYQSPTPLKKRAVRLGISKPLSPLKKRAVRLGISKPLPSQKASSKVSHIKATLRPQNYHLKSSAFEVEYITEGDTRKIRLNGRGWGHGVGLCQIGAAVMASRGYTYRQILSHYYKGAEIYERK